VPFRSASSADDPGRRLVAVQDLTTPRVSVDEARALAVAGRRRYVRVEGRIDSEQDFEDADHRPLVFRRTRLEARRGHDQFEGTIRVMIIGIAGLTVLVAGGLLLIGPFVMSHVFGQQYDYGRLGLAALGQGPVGVPLPAPGAVPVGLAVSGDQQRRHAHILP